MNFSQRRHRGDARSSRRLAFESLERRDLLAVMRLVTWNTLNGPDNLPVESPTPPTDGNYFRTILTAIGNETVQGNTKPIDILALQEIDESGNESLSKIESIFDTLYPSTDYEAVMSSEFSGDSTGFVYDTSTVSLVGPPVEITTGVTHPVLRGQFRPADTFGESDFYVYSIHLKAGTTGADEDQRGDEAIILRDHADLLDSGANVLFVGDFNMKTSAEAAYSTFLAAGAGQLQDVAAAPGNWTDNAAFKSLHSQDPRIGFSGMDDRFDIQFASGEFFDDVGIDYIAGSYHVFGNNGTHDLNGNITTGSGASPTVLTALANASDHLPVVADYEVIVSTPRVRLIETSGGTKVAEGGIYDTYGVVLDTVPSADVTVNITPSLDVNLGAGPGNQISLLFTPANALTPQFIVVNANNDALSEGTETVAVTHSAVSADAAYNSLSIPNLSVTVLDNEAPLILINELDSDQVGSPESAEFVELYDGGVGNVSLSGKTLVFFNGSNDQSYAVFNLNGMFTDANGFFVLGNSGVPGVDMTFGNGVLQNGTDAVAPYSGSFATNQPVTTVNLIDAVVYDVGTTVDAGLTPLLLAGQSQANESAGGSPTTHSLSRVPDGGLARVTETYVAQLPTPGATNSPSTPGVLLFHSGTRIDLAEGGVTDSYQIALKTAPTSDVVITVDPDSQTDLGLGAGVAIVLTFTPANALIPQTVTVTAVNDVLVESSPHFTQFTHSVSSSDSAYNAFPIGDIVGNIIDNDVLDATSVVISEIMYNPASSESGSTLPEWVEIVNTGTTTMDLAGWFLHDEDSPNWGTVPVGTYLYPNQVAVYFDADHATEEEFESQWSVPENALLLPVSWQSLGNSPNPGPGGTLQELLELRYGPNPGDVADVAHYDDASPWPGSVNGPSIYLKGLLLNNNNGANWAQSVNGVNNAIRPTGPEYIAGDIGSPGRAYIPGDYNMDGGDVDAADYVVWRHFVGSTTVRPPDGSGPTTGLPNGIVDEPDYAFWSQNFGRIGPPADGGGGSGESVVETTASESVSNAVSQSTSAATDDNSAVEALNFDFASVQLSSMPSAEKKLSVQSSSLPAASASANLLLLLDDNLSATVSDDDSFDRPREPADDDLADVDQFFEQLGDDALLALLD